MTLSDQIDRFINKAQSKIGRLGNELAFKKMNDDDCYQDQLFLIEELTAAIGLLQCCCEEGTAEENLCDILTDNEKYEIMSYLIDKGDLDSLPLFPYGSICVSNKILVGGGSGSSLTIPAHNSLTGLQGGLGSDYYHLSASEYTAFLGFLAMPSAVFTADIPVILSGVKTLGQYQNGQIIPAIGKTAQEVLLDIAQEFISPAIGFGITSGTIKEKGVAVTSVSMNYSTTANSATVTLRKLLKNATVVNNPSVNSGSFTHTPVNIIFTDSAGDRRYSYQVDYSNSATQTLSNTIDFFAPSFHGVGAANMLTTVTTVAGLALALPSSKEIRTGRSKLNVVFNPSLQRYFFVYPAAFGALASIIDQNGFNITAGFTFSTQLITLADGITNENYNFYISNTDTTQTNFVISFN